MYTRLLATAAIGALLAGPALAQTDNTAGAALSEEDIRELSEAFEEAGLTGFRPVTGGDVFRGMSADGTAAVIAVAPETGNNATGTGTTGDAGAGTGMTGSEMFQVTTTDGRTLYVVVPPEMTGMTTGDAGGTTGDADTTDTTETDTATTTTETTTTTGTDTATAAETDNDNEGETTTAQTDTDTQGTDTAGTTGDAGGAMQDFEASVDLSGREQVPPVETDATGQIDVTFDADTRRLSWTLDYSGLSSDATAAHFHGPADPGETAPPVVPVDEFADGAEGSADLTEDQAEQLLAGKWYFNLHTANNPNGEIRGQVTTAQ